ncbi:hypothetical protein Tco_1094807, partial [Tanacetum coccineum]
VGDGSMIRFWKDTWLGDAPFCSRFNRALADLNNLLMDIGSLNVEVDRDCVVSSLSTDGSYSVNIFMWRMLLDSLPHRLNLSSRGLDIDSILCPLPIFGGLFVVGVSLKSRRYLPVMNGTYSSPRGKLQRTRKTEFMSSSPPLVDALAF